MKKSVLLFLVFAFCSCQNKLELDGNWIILEMAHFGEKVYPETITGGFSLDINVAGYEGAEKISFNVSDSTVTFPGFGSDYINTEFSMKGDSIYFAEFNATTTDDNHKLTKRTFLRNFEIVNESDYNYIRLNSNLTIIRMVKEDFLFEERLDGLLNN